MNNDNKINTNSEYCFTCEEVCEFAVTTSNLPETASEKVQDRASKIWSHLQSAATQWLDSHGKGTVGDVFDLSLLLQEAWNQGHAWSEQGMSRMCVDCECEPAAKQCRRCIEEYCQIECGCSKCLIGPG